MNDQTRIGYMNSFPDFKCEGFNIEEYNKRFHKANVIINAKAKAVDYPEHWGGLSVKTVIRGSENYQTRKKLYSVDTTNYLLFNEGRYYSSWINSPSEVESFTLNFSPDFERKIIRSLTATAHDQLGNPYDIKEHGFRFTEKLYLHDDVITPVIKKIYSLSNDTLKNATKLDILFFNLLERLVTQQQREEQRLNSNREKVKASTKAELFERLSRAKDFMNELYYRDLTLAQMADVACLNQYYFLKQFKLMFSVTPHQYLTRRRLSVASQLLKKSGQNVSEVCYEIGFSDIASFTKLFKRNFGVPPKQYQKSIGWVVN